jgi:hypothetical protein
MGACSEVMLLIDNKWNKSTFIHYNTYKETNIMTGITAAMVLKKVKPFKTELNLDMGYMSYGGVPLATKYGMIDFDLTYKNMKSKWEQ